MSPYIICLSITLMAGYLQAGVISGHYGGHLDGQVEAHDFSGGLVQSETHNYESLGSYGDHLQESHFPSDYAEGYKGAEYHESSAASEHLGYGGGYEHQHYPQYEHEPISYGHDVHLDSHDFDSKPVPGINHGKGALSYSTTYEFKDPKP